MDPDTSKTSTVTSSSRWVCPSTSGGSFAPMPHSPAYTSNAAGPTPHTRIGWNTIVAKISLPPFEASGNFLAFPPSPQWPRALRKVPARDERKPLIAKRIWRDSCVGDAVLAKTRSSCRRDRANGSAAERNFPPGSVKCISRALVPPMQPLRCNLHAKFVERVALATDARAALRGAPGNPGLSERDRA